MQRMNPKNFFSSRWFAADILVREEPDEDEDEGEEDEDEDQDDEDDDRDDDDDDQENDGDEGYSE